MFIVLNLNGLILSILKAAKAVCHIDYDYNDDVVYSQRSLLGYGLDPLTHSDLT